MRLPRNILFIVGGAIAVVALVVSARANVCTSAGCATSKPLAEMTATDRYVRCTGYVGGIELTPGTSTGCATVISELWSEIIGWKWVLTSTGWYRHENIPAVVAPPPLYEPKPYRCTPKSLTEYRWDFDIIALDDMPGVGDWYCDQPDGVYPQQYCGNVAKIAKGILKQGPAAVATYIKANRKRPCTAIELAILDRLRQKEGLYLIVAPTTSATRPVYPRLVNNTRGKTKVGDIRVKDAAGDPTPCQYDIATARWPRLQNADGTSTMYFAVPGGYTLCKFVGGVSK